jgi:AraC-like DNA-binding protein
MTVHLQIEKTLNLSHGSVQLATVQWDVTEDLHPGNPGYQICQRLSVDHPALRNENLPEREVFPHVRSMGFLTPGRIVRLLPLETPFRVLHCAFEKEYFESTTEIELPYWDEHFAALMAIKDKRLETLIQGIYGELIQPDFGHDLLIETAWTLVLVEMARYGRRTKKANGQGAASGGVVPWQMRRIRERIEASLEMGYPSLAELAELCGISQSHLLRTFKASTGWTLHKYIAEERMRAAQRMLVKDRLNSAEVAARLGFSSAAYFATAFHRMTGKTPTGYSRQARAMNVGSA